MNHWCAVNVKHYVAAIPQMSPSHNCLQHRIYLLKLDISEAKSVRAPRGEPALSVIFLRYKHDSICAKVVHIAYEPISAEIYVLAAFSDLADIYVGALLAIQPTYMRARF